MLNPNAIRLESTTYCQLKCPACPTARGEIDQSLGSGFLEFSEFKRLIDDNKKLVHVELSNWGELFLNPNLIEIMKYAFEKGVILTASNGANLNTVKKGVHEALVKFRFSHITCSIDGASQGSYSQYRVHGNYDRVIEQIKLINTYKSIYKSSFPRLLWKYIAFKHNQHEIDHAKALAKSLGMDFIVSIPWDVPHSVAADPEIIRKYTRSKVGDRKEYSDKYGNPYLDKRFCKQMWLYPQINWDGKLLGCCVNRWGDYGNIFTSSLYEGVNNKKMEYARKMLLGQVEAKDDIPCSSCDIYKVMEKSENWMKNSDISETFNYRLASIFGRYIVKWIFKSDLIARNTLGKVIDSEINSYP